MRQPLSTVSARFAVRASVAVVMALGLAFVVVPRARAQAQYGTITGTVTDPSGAVVPGAKVVLTNAATSETRTTATDAAGLFSFTTVPMGTYSVTVSHRGFKKLRKADIVVNAGAQVGIAGLTLALGSATQTVEVSGQAYYVVPTTTGAKEETITSQQIENMPLEGRSAVGSVLILPGVVNSGFNPEVTGYNSTGNGGGLGGFNVNGGRPDEISITNNGTDNIDPGNNGGAAAIPDKEMVSEVTVQTSNFSAANPKGPVVINTVTKSGTSQFHGEAYWTGRRPSWNANDWLNNQAGLARPNSTFNYYGGQIGGPILIPGTSFNKNRNKAFFFIGGEWMRQTQDLGVHDGSVPTALMRKGNFTQLASGPYANWANPSFTNQGDVGPCNGVNPVANDPSLSYEGQTSADQEKVPYTTASGATVPCGAPGIIDFGPAGSPTGINPAALAFFKQMPMPNHTPTAALPWNYISDVASPENHDTIASRVDYDFTENTKLYVDYQYDSDYAVDPYGLWWGGSTIPYPGTETAQQHDNQLGATLVQVLSPTLTNEINVGTTRLVLPWALANPAADQISALGYPYQGVFPNTTGFMPSLTTYDNAIPNLINAQGNTVPTTYAEKWLNNMRDDFSLVAGNHLLKFGVYFEHTTNDQPTGDPRGNLAASRWGGAQSGNVYADLELGQVSNGTGAFSQSNAQILPALAYNELDAYIEDTWRATPRLTLTYGVRFDHMGWAYDKLGDIATFSIPRYISSGGYLCRKPGVNGCGDLPGQNPFTGGTAPVGAYPGIMTAVNTPGTPLSGMPSPGPRFAPNFGFAYDLTGHASSILRGGIGVYYYRDQFNLFSGAVANPPVVSNVSLNGTYYLADLNSSYLPNCSASGAIYNGACIANLSVLSPTDNRTPYTVSYSLTWSQKLPWQTVLESSYVGNVSRNQILPGGTGNGGFNYNLIPQGAEFPMWNQVCNGNLKNCAYNFPTGVSDQSFVPYPNYGGIDFISHQLYQDYNSLQITATRTTPHLMYSLAYTFSKALGVSGIYNSNGFPVDPFNYRGRSYGPLPYDHTNVFSAQYNVVLPNVGTRLFGGNAFADEALNGWQITGITSLQQGAPLIDANSGAGAGTSITLTGGPNFNADVIAGTPDTTVHPILVSGCNPTANLQTNEIFNAACFESPAPGQNGEYQIPYIHGPGLINTDLGLFKSFAIGKSEVRKLQVRVEAFNVFNHPNGTLSVNGVESLALELPYAGYLQTPEANSTNNPGYLQDWTGHREMSLSLKFIF